MIKKFGWLLLFAAIACVNFIAPAQAQSDETETDLVDLEEVTCRDLLIADGEERSYLLVFMHGYMSGTTENTTIDGVELATATDEILDACIDEPDQKLFDAFEEHR